MNTSDHGAFMKLALELAKKGEGYVAPNPLVGCVIVHDNQVIGEGYHAAWGGPHAEVQAIGSVRDKELLKDCTLYVTLEPCAHFGKTPPCSNLIVEMKIPRVVVGCRDPFPQVNGKGIEQLRENGVEVISDVLEEECRWLNRRFFTFHEKHRPYVVLKWAQSVDGFMDVSRNKNVQGSFMISHPDTQVQVHRWRAQEAAILIGKNTLFNDNPSLTVRRVEGKNPLRVVLSAEGIDIANLQISNDEAPTVVITNRDEYVVGSVHNWACGDVHNPENVLSRLHREGVLSVLIEGGAHVLQSFMDAGLWDEVRIITGSIELHSGLIAPSIEHGFSHEERSATDVIRYYYNAL
jgi:diaminohydroxyphosphoribosylaminopyrimidine deaminase/5-amino-6-(5-phosphoribosylamino)uracil reductase